MFRRSRNCCCMNNNMNNDCDTSEDILETKCDNVVSYSDDMYDSCNCGFDEELDLFPEDPMLAQCYVPIQYMDKTFKPCVGLKMGTIFPELVSPYFPGQSMEEINFIERSNQIGKGCNKCC